MSVAAEAATGGRAVSAPLLRRCLGLAFALMVSGLFAADPAPVMVQSAPGRFEVSAFDASMAHAIAGEAEQGWRVLAPVLGLPEAFSSPIYLRVGFPEVPAGEEQESFRHAIEPGGIVSLRLRKGEASRLSIRRALVRGMILRLAVARHGAGQRLTCPSWLEVGAVGWWQSRADAADLDARKLEAARTRPAPIERLMLDRIETADTSAGADAAFWLLTVLQAESGREKEWPAFLHRVIAGDDPLIALVESYPGRFDNPRDRELWWQTGYHQARRQRTLPILDAAESHLAVAALARFVVLGRDDATDRIVSLQELLPIGRDPFVRAEVTRRNAELSKLVPALHPFFQNAGLSLADYFTLRLAEPWQKVRALKAFDQDWRDAVELEAAMQTALDRMERR